MKRARWLGGVLIGSALAAGLVASAFAATSASGALTPTGAAANRYTLTVTNTGSDAILCMRFTAASGVTVTTVSGPAGTSQTGSTGFAAQDISIPPGQSAAWVFTTSQPYPANAGGTLLVSSTCASGSDVSAPVTGPPGGEPTPTPTATPTPSPTPTPAEPCRCRSFFVLGSRVRTPLINNKVDLDINLAWTLVCTSGRGGCEGTIDVDPPPGFQMRLPRTRPVRCVGRCDKTKRGNFRASMRTRFRNFTPRIRAGRTYVVRVRRTCQGRRIPGALAFSITFNRNGVVDRKQSDLNADGRPDGA